MPEEEELPRAVLIVTTRWQAAITIPEILRGVQELLDAPNNDDPANAEAHYLLKGDPKKYNEKVSRAGNTESRR